MTMTNSNKITNTKVGDDIHFYINGAEDRGIVVKMNNDYVTVFKESSQSYDDIHINDTFFIKDILVNKEWDKMEDGERFEALQKIHAPSPRFIMKSWNDLPKEIKELLTKNNAIETSHKKGEDDDMNNTTRIYDKALNNRGKPNPSSVSGKVTAPKEEKAGEKQSGAGDKDSKQTDAGDMKESKYQYRKNPEQIVNHQLPDQFKTIDEDKLGAGSKGTKNTTGQNYLTEGGEGIGVNATLSGHTAADRQSANWQKGQDRAQARAQQEKDKPATDKKVSDAMGKLKAWQLWLAKREQEVLKEDSEAHSWQKGREGKERTDVSDIMHKFDLTREEATAEADKYNSSLNSKHKDPKLGDPREKAWEEWLEQKEKMTKDGVKQKLRNVYEKGKKVVGDLKTMPDVYPSQIKGLGDSEKSWEDKLEELKSNTERSIHGNAGRNPNAGVNTNTGFDAPKDYEGFSHSGIRPEQFKHERKKPKVTNKERVNIGSTAPPPASQGTGDGGNPYNTKTQNKDKKGRAEGMRDRN